MENINQILKHPLFLSSMTCISGFEKNREFCKHGIEHSMDVARIAYIHVLEQNLPLSKPLVYAAALLHDLGRSEEYVHGISHATASMTIAADILKTTDFSENEKSMILDAIQAHRSEKALAASNFAALIYAADKASRLCCFCKAADACYWPEQLKNHHIED